MPSPIESHVSVSYVVAPFADRTASTSLAPIDGGRQLRICTTCPGCGGFSEVVWVFGSGGSKGIFGGSAGRVRERLTDRSRVINCNCGHAHAGRPDSSPFFGCGAYWPIELP